MLSTIVESPSRGYHHQGALPAAPHTPATVFVVDDDEYLRGMLDRLISTAGFHVESCASAEEFLCLSRPQVPSCLLLDVGLPGASGLELQRQLGARPDLPIVILTGRSDVQISVQAMKAGAVDVLAKPVPPDLLLTSVQAAIEASRNGLRRGAAMSRLREHYASLTPRECEVMGLVISGLLNKQVAFELGISEITVKAHRGQVMRKMHADSLPHLVRMAAQLEVAASRVAAEFM